MAAGAGLYEQRINVARWFRRTATGLSVDADAMRTDDSGRRFWGFITTGPLTLLTLASIAMAWNPQSSRDGWWFAAALVMLVERTATLGYFIPTAVKLVQPGRLDAERASAIASRWVQFNRVRIALSVAGWLLALRALSLAG
jgi:uncharacterized membrane protein